MVGTIWWLSRREGAPPEASALLLAGWVTMPGLLLASLRWPALRLWLVPPSTLVTLGVLLSVPTGTATEQVGWLLLLAGILLGDVLGLWLWLRLVPASGPWVDPFSRHRWAAIAVHVTAVLLGIAIVANA